MTNMVAVIIPRTATLHQALRTRVARQAIEAGFGLYTDGEHTQLLPQPKPGWYRLAVKLRDIDPNDDSIIEEDAA